MPVTKIQFRPGIVKDTTDYSNAGGWSDANLMRFHGGYPQTMGGWQKITGTTGSALTVTGVPRSLHQWATLGGQSNIGIGTHSKYMIASGDTVYDITPQSGGVDIAAGLIDSTTTGGWGFGSWGAGAFGRSSSPPAIASAPLFNQPRIWHRDNFGEDLIINPRGGPMYYWIANGGSGYGTRALDMASAAAAKSITYDTGTPANTFGLFVSPVAQCVVAVGCTPFGAATSAADPMQIRWSDLLNPFTWTPGTANSAGGQRLSAGSYIVGYLPTFSQTLLWTDRALYSMTYTGNSYVFSFGIVADNVSLISPNAAISNGPSVFWMDTNSFRMYDGAVVELPCPVKQYVFGSINRTQAWKSFAGHNHNFSEVWFFYPVGNEVDSYVIYNYLEQTWSVGKLSRTAWLDRQATPVAADPSGNLYWHETGFDADGQPLQAYIESADMDINGGDEFAFAQKIIPDVQFLGSAANPTVSMDLMRRDNGNDPKFVQKSLPITPSTRYLYGRIRGRRLSVRFGSSQLGCAWRLGNPEVELQPNGRR